MVFSFDFGWYSIHYDIVAYGQNPFKRDESYLSAIPKC